MLLIQCLVRITNARGPLIHNTLEPKVCLKNKVFLEKIHFGHFGSLKKKSEKMVKKNSSFAYSNGSKLGFIKLMSPNDVPICHNFEFKKLKSPYA